MRSTILSIAWLLCSVACGQIEVTQDAAVGDPVVAKVQAVIPEGAVFDGGWKASKGVQFIPHSKDTLHVWVAKGGTYSLSFSGFWLHTEKVTFTDGAGNEITITSYLGHGFISEDVEFTVKGDAGPDPPIPPDPTPGGPQQMVLFYHLDQLDNMPAEQRALLKSLTIRKDLTAAGHLVLEIVEAGTLGQSGPIPDRIKGFVDSVRGDPLPRIAMAPREGGKVVDYPLPANYEDLVKLLNNPPEVK